ncbi:hypothetical protein VM1G_04922 [Cytospora mali]|uniref:Rhodopsin domain-containing protein n=1 Tax=Cytospora mali TaxID=578113 RepID=A0A194VYY2_CYTMA|nr:hypothetical protein VM1G_04922 [Valsa mali]
MAIVAMILTAGTVSVFLAAAFAADLGIHLQEVLADDPAKFALHMRLFVPAQLLWAASNTCVKFSILSLYTTLFPNKRVIQICYATMALTTAYFIMVFLEGFLLCKPVQFNWDKTIAGICTGENTAYLVAGVTNLVVDMFIVILPMPLVFRLQMTLSRRISVAGMFSLGALICVMSQLRVLWLANWNLSDMTYTVTPGAIYSILEPTLGVVNACLPTIKPAINKMFGPGTLNWSRRDSVSKNMSGEATVRNRRSNFIGPVKGNTTREFDHLEDQIHLHKVRVEYSPERKVTYGNNITVDKEFKIHSPGDDNV